MNKYEKSLNNIIKCWYELDQNHFHLRDALNLLNLVEKATPMKPNRQDRYCGRCDINRLIKGNDKYCSVCGQKIDWSEEK